MPEPFSTVLGNIAAPLTAAASLGSAALQRRWALKDWQRVNAYNHPSAQVARLREAGLPLASMFSGSGGSTSSDVRSSNVDPSLGVAQGISAYMMNRMQRKQMQLVDEQIREQSAKADISEGERNWNIRMGRILPIKPDDPASEGGKFHSLWQSNQMQTLDLGKREKEANVKSAEVIADLQRATTQGQIDHILQTIGLSKENQRGQKIINDINDILTSNIGDGKWDIIQSMIYRFFFGR